jgi:monofunctional biosynthetic peptidoglycan transglycosylase
MAKKESKGCLLQIKKILLWVFVIHLVYIFLCKWVDPPITITQIANSFEGEGLKRDYIGYDEMGRNIKLAVMASEDQLFPEHDGFDIKAIKKAIKYNEKHPAKTRGASTISQQTAKNVFLWQHGGFFRKGLEVYYTFMIELIWGKERILETYLNVAEMGPGIFGVQAAARKYFKKDAANLTQREAAMIAACLPNPKKFTVVPTSRYVNKRAPRIMQQMNNLSGDEEIESLLK